MTAQIPDSIWYLGSRHNLLCEPFSDYLKKNKLRRTFKMPDTANQRGYRSKWLIEDSRLYLTSIFGHSYSGKTFSLEDFFQNPKGKQFAFWFSGTLRLSKSKVVRRVHSGYSSLFEKEIFLELEEGAVKNYYEKFNHPSDFFKEPYDEEFLEMLDVEKYLSSK